MVQKGIIIAPSFAVDQSGVVRSPFRIDRQYLRFCAMYWDLVEVVLPAMIGPVLAREEATREASFLQAEGRLLFRQGVTARCSTGNDANDFQVGFIANFNVTEDFFSVAQVAVYRKHGGEENGWSIGQASGHLVMPPPSTANGFFEGGLPTTLHLDEARRVMPPENLTIIAETTASPCIDINLFEALPVPDTSVALEDILSFKNRRAAEFERFRFAMDALYVDVASSGCVKRALDHSVAKVRYALGDLDRVVNETTWQRIRGSISVKVDVNQLITTLAAAAVTSALGHAEWAIALGAASLIKMVGDPAAWKPKLPTELKDYAYLYHAKNESLI